MEDLSNFIQESRSRGYSREEIEQELLSAGWPPEEINQAFSNPQEQSIIRKKGFFSVPDFTKEFNLQLTIVFLIATLILAFTFSILQYELTTMDFTVTDPVSGEKLTGFCETPDCSEVKEAAWDSVKNNLTENILLATLISLVIAISFAFITNKDIVFWTVNALYLILVIIMVVLWFAFT
tara:strand:- start:966 stop:1505 length:540 start_codon:yes stop_codon:yes gene_type:complete